MSKKRILIVGFDPNRIQFGSERGLTSDSVNAAGKATNDRLTALGCDVHSWLISPDATTEPLLTLLQEQQFDVILVAAGIRGLPEHTLLFESIMNVIHHWAPSASLCFNSHPTNALEAILRHVQEV
jgi:hypothetical protein